MHTLRGWIFYLWFSITLIPAATTVLLLWPFASAEFRYNKVALVWCRLMVNSLRAICGVQYRVIGLENLPKSSEVPVVVLSKHQSAWETLFLPLILGNPAGFVYKKSLHMIPFFGWALKSMRMIAIDRKEGRSAYQLFWSAVALSSNAAGGCFFFLRARAPSRATKTRSTKRAARALPFQWAPPWFPLRSIPAAAGRVTVWPNIRG